MVTGIEINGVMHDVVYGKGCSECEYKQLQSQSAECQSCSSIENEGKKLKITKRFNS